jgi:hypothetical protein
MGKPRKTRKASSVEIKSLNVATPSGAHGRHPAFLATLVFPAAIIGPKRRRTPPFAQIALPKTKRDMVS